MSAVDTYLDYITPIIHDSLRNSVETVVDDVSYLDLQSFLCLPSANLIPLIVTASFLSFRSITYAMIFLSCSYLGYWGFFGSTSLCSWNWYNYFHTSAYPFLQKTLNPCLITYWVSMVSFLIMLVGGVGSTKVEIAFKALPKYFLILCRAWETNNMLLHTMEHQLALPLL